jgi:hypothetical protein
MVVLLISGSDTLLWNSLEYSWKGESLELSVIELSHLVLEFHELLAPLFSVQSACAIYLNTPDLLQDTIICFEPLCNQIDKLELMYPLQ